MDFFAGQIVNGCNLRRPGPADQNFLNTAKQRGSKIDLLESLLRNGEIAGGNIAASFQQVRPPRGRSPAPRPARTSTMALDERGSPETIGPAGGEPTVM